MRLREYIYKIIAVTLFISAGLSYLILCESSNNPIILETNRSPDLQIAEDADIKRSVVAADDSGIEGITADTGNKNESSENNSDEPENIGNDNFDNDIKDNNSGSYEGKEELCIPEGLIDINTADKTQLMTLPGIGPSKAEAIEEYRNENGGFRAIDELMRVPGIKQGTFDKIKDRIFVSGSK